MTSNKKCLLPFCNKKHYAGGYCAQHYQAMRRNNGVPTGKNGKEMYDAIQKITGILTDIDSVDEWWLSDTGYCIFCGVSHGHAHDENCVVLRIATYLGGGEIMREIEHV